MRPLDSSLPRWPKELAPATPEPMMEAPLLMGPRPALGAPQRIRNDAGAWALRLTDVALSDWKITAYRAILLRIAATSGALYMPMWDWIRAPVPLVSGVAAHGVVAAAAAQMLTRFRMTPPSGATLTAGQFVGLGERGHGIYALEDIEGSADKWISVWPPLREALAIDDVVELYDPVIRMQLDITQLRTTLGALRLGIRGVVTLDFVEDNW